jgi:GNAT superfamily N-acetyltransferase
MVPANTPTIRPLAAQDADAVSVLVLAAFERFIAPDWEPEGRATFVAECGPEHFQAAIETSTCALGAFVDGALAGVSLMPRPSLLRVFFVDPAAVRQGVGRALWDATRALLESAPGGAGTVELNASPYALPFYRALGFVPISREYRKGGCRVTRMACWLPARSLDAEL